MKIMVDFPLPCLITRGYFLSKELSKTAFNGLVALLLSGLVEFRLYIHGELLKVTFESPTC